MDKLVIHATKRSLYQLVKEKLADGWYEVDLRPCKHCQFSSVSQRVRGHKTYFLNWDSYHAYFTLWAGQGQLRISSPSTGMKEIVISIPMEELADRGMTRTA